MNIEKFCKKCEYYGVCYYGCGNENNCPFVKDKLEGLDEFKFLQEWFQPIDQEKRWHFIQELKRKTAELDGSEWECQMIELEVAPEF